MSQVLIFPDAVMTVVDYLRDQLADRDEDYVTGLQVNSLVENPRPAVFLRVLRNGGGVSPSLPVVDNARVSVEAWHVDDHQAHALARLVRSLLHAMPGIVDTTEGDVLVTRADVDLSLFPDRDPLSDQPRWTITVDIGIRGRADTPGIS